jgi:hypothetical protein
LFLSGRYFVHDEPKLDLHRMNGDFAGNCNLMDEESLGEMVLPPGIINSGMRNPPEE